MENTRRMCEKAIVKVCDNVGNVIKCECPVDGHCPYTTDYSVYCPCMSLSVWEKKSV
jgi:hypothetical protein